MIILLIHLFTTVVFPWISFQLEGTLNSFIAISITITGCIMILGAVGIKFSANLGSTIFSHIFMGIGFAITHIFIGLWWCIIGFFTKMLPGTFAISRRGYAPLGATPVVSGFLAGITCAIMIILII